MRLYDESIFEEYAELFEALAEYDKTGVKKKLTYKIRANFTLDNDLLLKFKKYCKEKGFKMSSILERHIKEELRKAG
ncbi:MAG TPA: hypothetical protein VJ110_02605 [Candidatus Nanoarchaeia archaeon]|nr:hypothetical protein [Candidatus Nanoarchaeia archaeon]